MSTEAGQAAERMRDLAGHFKTAREGGPVRTCVSELAGQGAAAMEACVGGETTQEQAEAKNRLPGLYEAAALALAFDETYAREVAAVREAMVRTFDEVHAMECPGDIHAQALQRTVEERRRIIDQSPRNRGLLLDTLDNLEAAYEAEFGKEPTSAEPASSSSD